MRGQLLDKVSAVASGYLSAYIGMLMACFVVWCVALLLCDWIEDRHMKRKGVATPRVGGLALRVYVHVAIGSAWAGGALALLLQAFGIILVWLK